MTLLQAIILGIIQGLTEFIPISSTAHLVLASHIMKLFQSVVDLDLRAQQTTATIAVLQLGTLLAVLIYFSRDIVTITRAFVVDHLALITGRHRVASADGSDQRLSPDAWLGWLVIIGSIPVAVVGLLFKKQIEGTFTKNLWVIATMMISIAILLGIAELVAKQQRSMEHLGVLDAIAVGFAQCLALIPGSSRSGSTIMAGLLVGEKRETAARFSFLLSIPAVAASGLLELRKAIHILPHASDQVSNQLVGAVQHADAFSYGPLIIGTLVSAVVGYASIWLLLRYLRTHSTGIFIGYRIVVGSLILLLLLTGHLSAT